MSAFVVSHAHITAILLAFQRAARYDRPTPEELTRVGNLLQNENLRSVNHRYAHHPDKQVADEYVFPATLLPIPQGNSVVAALKLVQCLGYQSCETDDWETTEAAQKLRGITSTLIGALPGYDAAPWSI